VKIDGSFVRDLLTDRSSQATVKAIVELAKG
jgi:EAL domain-containing protein (putative c-di-GMP-specific phosphodiesterase class I)